MEIVIVGGGVMGLLSALVLVQAKCKVTILEKNAGALESSWAAIKQKALDEALLMIA